MSLYNTLEFEYIDKCPICGLDEDTWAEDDIGEVVTHGMYVIYRICRGCRTGIQNPRPTQESTLKAYKSNAYREFMRTGGGVESKEVRLQSLRAQRITTIIKNEKLTPARFLDVGSSLGVLTYQIYKTFDCDAWGQEPSDRFRELSSGFEGTHFVGELDELEGKFNVITSIHVLEHLANPIDQLKKLRELLTDDGVLILECPDGRTTHGMSIWHYVIFGQDTMKIALEEAGFEGPLVEGMRDRYFNAEKKTNIPSMVVIAPKNGPYIPPTPQKPLTD